MGLRGFTFSCQDLKLKRLHWTSDSSYKKKRKTNIPAASAGMAPWLPLRGDMWSSASAAFPVRRRHLAS